MTQQELQTYTNHRGYFCMLGTRDRHMQPSVTRAFGFKLSEDGKMISAFIPKVISEKHIQNLQDNQRAAFITTDPFTHVAYQFKGRYVSHQDCTESDIKIFQENAALTCKFIAAAFGEHMVTVMQSLNIFPLICVTFKIEDIFNQTPGPGAGKKTN